MSKLASEDQVKSIKMTKTFFRHYHSKDPAYSAVKPYVERTAPASDDEIKVYIETYARSVGKTTLKEAMNENVAVPHNLAIRFLNGIKYILPFDFNSSDEFLEKLKQSYPKAYHDFQESELAGPWAIRIGGKLKPVHHSQVLDLETGDTVVLRTPGNTDDGKGGFYR